jgi:putative transposase
VLHDLAYLKESKILDGHLPADHVHMLVSISPKYTVAQAVGFIKGKSAIHITRSCLGRRKNYHGMHFWDRDYSVSTVGTDDESISEYKKKQKKSFRQCRFGFRSVPPFSSQGGLQHHEK